MLLIATLLLGVAASDPPACGPFVENRGQFDADVRFRASRPGLNLWVTDDGFCADAYTATVENDAARVEGLAVKTTWVGASRGSWAGTSRPGTRNFLLGNQPDAWVTGVRDFDEVRQSNVYPNIDVLWQLDEGQPRFDFVVRPGGDPRRIKMTFAGATPFAHGSELWLRTEAGSFAFKRLKAFQPGVTRPVDAAFRVGRDRTVSFEVGHYDPTKTLVIDPMVYSTMTGGAVWDRANDIAVDAWGNAYTTGATGWTLSAIYPTTEGAYDRIHDGVNDAFVSKYAPDGKTLIYSTLIGSAATDEARGIKVLADGSVWITGTAFGSTSDFPTTADAFSQTHSGGGGDVFATRLSAAGDQILYSSYVGGDGDDDGLALAVAPDGSVVVVGDTVAGTGGFPTTSGAFDTTHNGNWDGFAFRLRPDLGLMWATYLGGNDFDSATDVAVDGLGAAYVTGITQAGSTPFPTTAGAFDTVANFRDAFVTKIAPNGASLIYSTFLGGRSTDEGKGIALRAGRATVVGRSFATNTEPFFPTTAGAYDRSHNGADDMFVTQLTENGSSLEWSTLIGGAAFDDARAVAVDPDGNVLVVGTCDGAGFPTTPDAHRTVFHGLGPDAILARLTPDGAQLAFATYIGGTNWDVAHGVVAGPAGDAFVAGETNDADIDFPTTEGVVGPTTAGTYDAFVFRWRFASALLRGTVTFQDRPSNKPTSVPIEVYRAGESVPLMTVQATIAPDGKFHPFGLPVANATLKLQSAPWLRRTLTVSASNTEAEANFVLVNGDIDANNAVGISDFVRLRAAFGTSPGSANWNPLADLDGSGTVNVADFLILRKNFGQSGQA